MNAIRSIYCNAPASIPVPDEFQNKNIEVIFLPVNDQRSAGAIDTFYGSIPDFPEHVRQGTADEREPY